MATIIKDAIERKRSGQLVVAPAQVSYVPPPYVEEIRELKPMTPETRELVEETRKKLKGFGSVPE